jgi:hypothetical protein
MKIAKSFNSVILAVNIERSSQFCATKKGKKGRGKSQFEKKILKKGINHILSWRNNP